VGTPAPARAVAVRRFRAHGQFPTRGGNQDHGRLVPWSEYHPDPGCLLRVEPMRGERYGHGAPCQHHLSCFVSCVQRPPSGRCRSVRSKLVSWRNQRSSSRGAAAIPADPQRWRVGRTSLRHRTLCATNVVLGKVGFVLSRQPNRPSQGATLAADLADQRLLKRSIGERHHAQTLDEAQRLQTKYCLPAIGTIDTWDALMMLGACVDPTDTALGAVSQLTHVEQTLDMMLRDGVSDEDLLIGAIIHDIGKVLLLTDEDPANVVGMNRVIGGEPGAGLHQVITQWSHDEFAYLRLVDVLPRHLSLLVRYHSVAPGELEPYLADRDREFYASYFRPFVSYDQGSKSALRRPSIHLSDMRPLIRRRLPAQLEL